MSTANAPSRQTLANRHNALLSTGPQTPEGKAASSRNALKTGLTGRTVLLPGDDADAYQRHLERFAADLKPSGDRETELVQSLADTQWRLNRIPTLEAGIYALARIDMADLFPDETPETRAALIQARTYLAYTRQLNNLHLQEARLRRHYEKDLAELRSLQSERQSQTGGQVSASGRLQPQMGSNFRHESCAVGSQPEPSANALDASSNYGCGSTFSLEP